MPGVRFRGRGVQVRGAGVRGGGAGPAGRPPAYAPAPSGTKRYPMPETVTR
ncbi:hypothetical protein GCM10025780_26280 [Frondihabitans cladoniiphilus]|uniref:Uncharacterized protein n=1 Tax=Frondihabitans cladoniiphilus TaxID=715785 RepID=A0ABP8W2W7_9MICO